MRFDFYILYVAVVEDGKPFIMAVPFNSLELAWKTMKAIMDVLGGQWEDYHFTGGNMAQTSVNGGLFPIGWHTLGKPIYGYRMIGGKTCAFVAIYRVKMEKTCPFPRNPDFDSRPLLT